MTRAEDRTAVLGPVRLDHVVLGVRDLQRATAALIAAGLPHAGGGQHTGRGTANSLFPLAEGYLELLTVTDAALARAHSPNRAQVAAALATREVIPLGYAFQVRDVSTAAATLRSAGQRVEGPVGMSRRNPDGQELTWRNLYLGASQWRTLLPFLITWDTPHQISSRDAPRLRGLELAAPIQPATSPSGGGQQAGHAYHLLGAADTGPGRFHLAGIDLQVSGTAAAEGITAIHVEGGAPQHPIGAGLDAYLTWTKPALHPH
ncbi:MAG TPA: VOC family protein [Beutenbergiaceae bacterium]|nr:VOC family protein [Beutenbergiaceae bacterium]